MESAASDRWGRGVIDGLMLLGLKSGSYKPCRGPQIVGVECNKT